MAYTDVADRVLAVHTQDYAQCMMGAVDPVLTSLASTLSQILSMNIKRN